jgi:copper(I)-binding protein
LTSGLLLGTALLGACAGHSAVPTVPATGTAPKVTSGLTLRDAWVKAAAQGSTALFGTLDNQTGTDLEIVSGTTAISSKIELHEVVTIDGTTIMRAKAGGFTVPAHGTLELKPGGDHLMVMGLRKPIRPGDTITATLALTDGSTISISAIGKQFVGANENYQPTGSTQMSMSPSTGVSPPTGVSPSSGSSMAPAASPSP